MYTARQRDYYNLRYRTFVYLFLRIHYSIRYQVVKYLIRKTLLNHFGKKIKLRILDFGSGLGEFGIFFEKELGHIYLGLDLSEEGVKYSQRILGFNSITLDILKEDIPINLGKFNVIFMHEVLEHLEFPELTLRRLSGLLLPNGMIIFTTPSSEFKSFIPKNPLHVKEYTKNQLKNLSKEIRMKIHIQYAGGYITSILEGLQRKMFPVGAQEKRILYKRLGIKETLWIIILKPLTALCIIESIIMKVLDVGYHYFCVIKLN